MPPSPTPNPMPMPEGPRPWLSQPSHRAWLYDNARQQLGFFRKSLNAAGGFDQLNADGTPRPEAAQELHTTTRMVHSYALGKAAGFAGGDDIIDAGMAFLWHRHRDPLHGGYLWSVGKNGRDLKLAYGHVFVLLAASSAKMIGHSDADRLLYDIAEVLSQRFWEEENGRFSDEFTRDWQIFSDYRGMNANMHGVEALLAAYEATAEPIFLDRAGRILQFFTDQMAEAHHWRIPEHYHADWRVNAAYQGDPMFRPAGTTPGHSLEFARLILQHWALSGRPMSEGTSDAITRAERLIDQAFLDGWHPQGSFVYTLDGNGKPAILDRYWWPLTEAIGALAAILKVRPTPENEARYRKLWQTADAYFIDHEHGGWHPEIDAENRPYGGQFIGKPDIYHALQACLLPLTAELARAFEAPQPWAEPAS